MKLLWEIFSAFFKIGLFSIGGGYAIIPMIREQVVLARHWLDMGEFTDIITISQMTPGPLAVNVSTFAGMKMAGIPGAVCATGGCVCMGVLISYVLYQVFLKFSGSAYLKEVLRGLKAGSLGLIASAAGAILMLAFFDGTSGNPGRPNLRAIVIFCVILGISRRKKSSPVLLMSLSGALGAVFYLSTFIRI